MMHERIGEGPAPVESDPADSIRAPNQSRMPAPRSPSPEAFSSFRREKWGKMVAWVTVCAVPICLGIIVLFSQFHLGPSCINCCLFVCGPQRQKGCSLRDCEGGPVILQLATGRLFVPAQARSPAAGRHVENTSP